MAQGESGLKASGRRTEGGARVPPRETEGEPTQTRMLKKCTIARGSKTRFSCNARPYQRIALEHSGNPPSSYGPLPGCNYVYFRPKCSRKSKVPGYFFLVYKFAYICTPVDDMNYYIIPVEIALVPIMPSDCGTISGLSEPLNLPPWRVPGPGRQWHAFVTGRREKVSHGGRYSYSALEDDGAGERMEMERKAARGASRETSALAARSYLRGHQRYSLLEHLRDIGSRIDKNWFIIRDSSVKTDRLMTLQPYDEQCPVPVTPGTREALMELFQALHHPYIYPVLDVDFANISSHTYVITVIPHNNKGTLKDLIYKSHWQDDWGEKYQQRSTGLPVTQVQRLGRQVLEALLFLQDRGFPPCGHLHSGNVILQNGVARLSGVENTLLGLTSRIYPIIKRRLRENRDAIDSVCFGHVLFEMCAGYELSAAHPTPKHLDDIAAYPQVVQVLEYIFGNGDQYPSIEEILCMDFFRNLDLREMRAAPLPSQFQIRYSPTIRNILKEVRRFQKQRSLQRRTRSLSRGETLEGEGYGRRDVRRGRRGGGTASGGEGGGGDTPTSSEASAGGTGGGTDEGVAPTGSAYNTPTASLAALSSPTSDVTPSPEHPTHRLLEVSSPQRQHPNNCQEVFHTPPHTPPTPQNHPIRNNHVSQAHNDRPLTTMRYPPRDSRNSCWSNSNHVTQNGHVGRRGQPWT
ncbi:PX domain-containing protein kinase-like protein [Penaeus indicus]|uniref:PX domain-containing protein kinase-like protein n=1 Tax=Penaeus indicus TaxID=29960 RepID=UPI00300D7CB6